MCIRDSVHIDRKLLGMAQSPGQLGVNLQIKVRVPFLLTYGDGVSTVDLDKLVKFHRSHGRIATITTVNIGFGK